MEREFWETGWAEGRTGFHQSAVNPQLERHWRDLDVAAGAKVLVPLCGKSLDMLWLRDRGFAVVGVEVVRQAVEAFFVENDLRSTTRRRGPFTVWAAEGIEIYEGDFFALTPEDAAGAAAVYDRASLIALPPAMRRQYAAHMGTILKGKPRMLLLTYEYPEAEMNGPPFSVTEEDVAALYGDGFEIERVASRDALGEYPHLRERGLSRLTDKAYVLRAR